MKIVILDGYTLNPGDIDWSALESLGSLEVYPRTEPGEVYQRVKSADIVLTNKTPLIEADLSRLGNLKLIGVLATGYDVVDLEAAAEANIPVANVPGYSTNSVVQLTWSLILTLTNQVDKRSRDVKGGGWSSSLDFSYGTSGLSDLAGKTLGLVGLGEIGSSVARIGQAFGMNILAAVRSPEKYQTKDIQVTSAHEDVFRAADIISLHCPLTLANQQFVNANLIEQMKPSTYLINTARGGLVDEVALAAALNQERIAGAGLDVLSSEPPQADNPLLGAKNCLVTPHIGWASQESRQRLVELTAENVKSFLNGQPKNLVN